MLIRSRTYAFVLALPCVALVTLAVSVAPASLISAPSAVADDGDGGDGGDWGPTINIGIGGGCFGRLGLCLGGLRPIPGAALRPAPPAGPAPRVGPRGTWP